MPLPGWVDELPLADDEVGLAVRAYVEADRAFVDAVSNGTAPEPGSTSPWKPTGWSMRPTAQRRAGECRSTSDRPDGRCDVPGAAVVPRRSNHLHRRDEFVVARLILRSHPERPKPL